jgi:hypothetical protein
MIVSVDEGTAGKKPPARKSSDELPHQQQAYPERATLRLSDIEYSINMASTIL